MPEGHTIHRIARQFSANFVGRRASVTSPQGRFAVGAAELDGQQMTDARAVGKHLLLQFGGDWLHVHLGIYGAWDFSGEIRSDASLYLVGGKASEHTAAGADGENEDSLHSIGAPRKSRVRMGERETGAALTTWPPEPVGQVRARILTETTLADLRGPTVCEVIDDDGVTALIQRLGPDPLAPFETHAQAQRRFVDRLRRSRQPVGQLLMDQSVVAGIGNIYRAEMLFRARMSPHRPGAKVTVEEAESLWRDWVRLLKIGVETGLMLTMSGLRGKAKQDAIDNREDRHWVYKREGLPCRVCGTAVSLETMQQRKLYWCPSCQQ
ncbi:Fpg/Nei family DNA glycosylase [Agrococcus casei]|uniref:DNA-(apurinic or apyrimidinic site) lyase n=1 Tax=Agrococcus casei LMG 22410 TaxID=1255656 RepID=A0A1R4G6E3_9MICO|nr:DNA-formamidopyrimidine glycosylase family protein [Agrococcus casei]SJM63768.1 Formamidopyrimidine-DNA glycosylase [Agrococcus casei LMG 22410]